MTKKGIRMKGYVIVCEEDGKKYIDGGVYPSRKIPDYLVNSYNVCYDSGISIRLKYSVEEYNLIE